MKTIMTAAAVLFAANVSATDYYYGMGEGNQELHTQRMSASDFVDVQPGIGDSFDPYHGLADGNVDLFKGDGTQSIESTGRPDIYGNVSRNPDLDF